MGHTPLHWGDFPSLVGESYCPLQGALNVRRLDTSASPGRRQSHGARRRPTVWAIGGGKGGVGKSLITSSLAISFARRGMRCALVDLDLGAANAHSLLGMQAPPRTLTDFVENRVEHLSEILQPTPFEDLQIACGTRASLQIANPKYRQKERLLEQIPELDCDHVFLDLSAGCAFNVLDFFLAAEKRLAVVIPERTSVENTQHFLKTAFFRSLRKVAQKEPLRSAIQLALESRGNEIRSARQLVEVVSDLDEAAGSLLAKEAAAFAPMLLINQVSHKARPDAAFQMALSCRHFLAASVRERARLPRDEMVREALAKEEHVLSAYPGTPFVEAIGQLADDLIADKPVEELGSPLRKRELADRAAKLPPFEGQEPGPFLRDCRKQLGLELNDMKRQTRIRVLDRIELGQYKRLPSLPYVAAFVRQYARTLGIEEAEAVTSRYVQLAEIARAQ